MKTECTHSIIEKKENQKINRGIFLNGSQHFIKNDFWGGGGGDDSKIILKISYAGKSFDGFL